MMETMPSESSTLRFARESWHHDKGNAGQKDAGNAVVGGPLGPQVRCGKVGDIWSKPQETDSNDLQRLLFISFAARHIRINRRSSEWCRSASQTFIVIPRALQRQFVCATQAENLHWRFEIEARGCPLIDSPR
jgi:hypothetical protein